MAAAASAYGLRPTQMLGESPFKHGFRQYKIASGYATGIFQGDLVKLVIGGTIEKDTGTATATPVGVFWGVEYMSALQGLLHRNQWTASTTVPTGTTAWAYVYDHPDQLFEMQGSATLGQNSLGTNAAIVQNAGSTFTGNSGITINAATIAATATLPVRIVDYVNKPGFSTLGDAFPDMIVRLNTHFNRTALGIDGA